MPTTWLLLRCVALMHALLSRIAWHEGLLLWPLLLLTGMLWIVRPIISWLHARGGSWHWRLQVHGTLKVSCQVVSTLLALRPGVRSLLLLAAKLIAHPRIASRHTVRCVVLRGILHVVCTRRILSDLRINDSRVTISRSCGIRSKRLRIISTVCRPGFKVVVAIVSLLPLLVLLAGSGARSRVIFL